MATQTVRRLSDEDLSILALETETVAGHTCKVILLEDRIDANRLRESIGSRLGHALPMRLRLTEVDGELWWAQEPEVDLDAHVIVADDAPARCGSAEGSRRPRLRATARPLATAVANRGGAELDAGWQRPDLVLSPCGRGRLDDDEGRGVGAVG